MAQSPNAKLIEALDRFDEAGVLEALGAGADPNRFDADGRAPLFTAIAYFDGRPFLKPLVDHGADINAMCYRNNQVAQYPIQLAIMNGAPWMVEFLIEKGVDLHLYDNGNGNLLHVVAAHNVKEIDSIARLLLQKGLDPNALNLARRKPWEQAFFAGNLAAAEALLEPCDIDQSAFALANSDADIEWLQARMDAKRLARSAEDIPVHPKVISRVTM